MRVLEFEVTQQRLKKKPECDFSNLVADTAGYLKAKFYFVGNDWSGCNKAASFWVDDREHAVILDKDDSCIIPEEALISDTFSVSLYGTRKDNYRIRTGKTKVLQEVI